MGSEHQPAFLWGKSLPVLKIIATQAQDLRVKDGAADGRGWSPGQSAACGRILFLPWDGA